MTFNSILKFSKKHAMITFYVGRNIDSNLNCVAFKIKS